MSVTLHFCGAARTVTGSCYLFETAPGASWSIAGCFRAEDAEGAELRCLPVSTRRHRRRPADPRAYRPQRSAAEADARGLSRPILATRGTIDLCSYMLPDAGSIQEARSHLNRRNAARGRPRSRRSTRRPTRSPRCDRFVRSIREWVDVCPACARATGMPAICSARRRSRSSLRRRPIGTPLRILFSGDIGPDAKLLQPDPEAPAASTTSSPNRPMATATGRRRRPARRAAPGRRGARRRSRKGALLIPAFAVERTQELIVDLVDLMDAAKCRPRRSFSIRRFAIRATEVFRQHAKLDPAVDLDRLLNSPHLRFTETVDESKAIAKLTGFHIIIAASGMCDAGRIRHHLKHWLWNAQATVLLVGFQAQGTLGRFLLDGARRSASRARRSRSRRASAASTNIPATPTGRSWRAGSPRAARSIGRCSWSMVRSPRSAGSPNASPNDRSGGADISAVLDDIYELSTRRRRRSTSPTAPARARGGRRARLAQRMSKLVLDINDRIEAAADDRARGVIIRRLRRALEE